MTEQERFERILRRCGEHTAKLEALHQDIRDLLSRLEREADERDRDVRALWEHARTQETRLSALETKFGTIGAFTVKRGATAGSVAGGIAAAIILIFEMLAKIGFFDIVR